MFRDIECESGTADAHHINFQMSITTESSRGVLQGLGGEELFAVRRCTLAPVSKSRGMLMLFRCIVQVLKHEGVEVEDCVNCGW